MGPAVLQQTGADDGEREKKQEHHMEETSEGNTFIGLALRYGKK